MLVDLLKLFHFDSHYTLPPHFSVEKVLFRDIADPGSCKMVSIDYSSVFSFKTHFIVSVSKTIFLSDFIHFLGTNVRCGLGDICFTWLNFRFDYIHLRVKTDS